MQAALTLAAAIFAMIAAAPALAHHSLAAQFDEKQPVSLKGVVSKIEWVNPHVYLYIDVRERDGRMTTWAVETFPPATLRRGGLTRDKLGLGREVTLLAYQARNQTKLAFLRSITFPNGQQLVIWLGDIERAR